VGSELLDDEVLAAAGVAELRPLDAHEAAAPCGGRWPRERGP
jgi:hypothetical protein